MIRIDLTAQVIEVERDGLPDPLITLTTGAPANLSENDAGSDICLHRNGANWQPVWSDVGATTRGMGGSSFRVHARNLVEEGEYSVRSYIQGTSTSREFNFVVQTEHHEDGLGCTLTLTRGTPTTWILEDEDPVRFNETPLLFNVFVPLFANERTGIVHTTDATTPGQGQRPTVWDRLDEDAFGEDEP